MNARWQWWRNCWFDESSLHAEFSSSGGEGGGTSTRQPPLAQELSRHGVSLLFFIFIFPSFFPFLSFPFLFFRRVLAKTCSRVLRMVVASVGRRSAVRSHLCWLAFCCSRDCRSYILPTEICLSGKKKEPKSVPPLCCSQRRSERKDKTKPQKCCYSTPIKVVSTLHFLFFLYFLYTFCITSAI